ncbi:MAG: 5-methylthioadenosine/S-adenosylhomocysteine deaminase [Thermoplasmata archaeon]|nr:5-methylthioadenosine/S-adenosylhomocysteine deaminase [Thermoplasmata archaeon]
MSSLRIRNATIVTQDDARRTAQGDLYCEDGRIVAVGTPEARREADRELDGTGQVVLPGLINLHTHLAMGLLRGVGDDMPLEAWLNERIWPAEARITEPLMRAGVELGLAEMVASGTTSFLDMYWMEEEVVAPACRSAGVRGWLGEGFVDVGQTEAGQPNRKLAPLERFVKAAKKDPLVTPCPTPHGAYTCNPETYAESARIAKEHGVPLHTHCSETRTEVHDVQAKTGHRPVARIAQAGALTDRTVLAHCGWITKGEVGDIARVGAAVAHCPVSNLKLATGGVAPVVELQEAGVRVGLGTDGAASNNGLDLFETMKFAALVQKHQRWDATALPANTALDMATRHAADALHRPDLGRLVPGATADLIMVDFRRPHLVPRHDAVSHLVYSASGRDVSATVVGGRVLIAHGRHETLDLQKVLAAAQAAGDALVPR